MSFGTTITRGGFACWPPFDCERAGAIATATHAATTAFADIMRSAAERSGMTEEWRDAIACKKGKAGFWLIVPSPAPTGAWPRPSQQTRGRRPWTSVARRIHVA